MEDFYSKKMENEFHPCDPHHPRRVFYADIGDMPGEQAKDLITKIIKERSSDQ